MEIDITKPPENLRYYSVDEVGECVDGISPETYAELYAALGASVEAGTAKPLGGDHTEPSTPGKVGTTEEPIISDGEFGSDLPAAWPKLSEAARKNIWEAAEKKRLKDEGLDAEPPPLIDGGRYHQPDRCVGGITNEQRAIWAREGLAEYAGEKGYLKEPLETVAGDFCCDLVHLATAFGYNPHRFIELMASRAKSNFDAEATEEPHEGHREEPPFLEKPLGEEHQWAAL